MNGLMLAFGFMSTACLALALTAIYFWNRDMDYRIRTLEIEVSKLLKKD